MNNLYNTYKNDGYYWILVWADSLSTMQAYFDANSWSATNDYYGSDWVDTLVAYSNAFSDGGTGIPQTGLVDRDGDVRKYDVGQIDYTPARATEWTNAVKELLGVS